MQVMLYQRYDACNVLQGCIYLTNNIVNTVTYLTKILNVIYFGDGKAEFSAITQVFSVKLFFRNHSNAHTVLKKHLLSLKLKTE